MSADLEARLRDRARSMNGAMKSGGLYLRLGDYADEDAMLDLDSAVALASQRADIEKRDARISELEAALAEMTRLATSFTCDEIDYMLINKLGDPEKQHNIKWARKLGITVFADLAGGKRDG